MAGFGANGAVALGRHALTFPRDWGQFAMGLSSWGDEPSACGETAQVASAGAAVVVRTSMGVRLPSADCRRWVL